MNALDVWFMTTGEAGYRTQARGLARALSPAAAREWVVDLRAPWRAGCPAHWPRPSPSCGLDPARDRPGPPWPDVLVTCGRRATGLSIAIRRASQGRCASVHIQNPLTTLSAFDLVVAMDHDRLAGPNVISVPTALHDVTAERLAVAADLWRERLAPDRRPLIGVLLGGAVDAEPVERLLSGLVARAPSGRTRGWRSRPPGARPSPCRELLIAAPGGRCGRLPLGFRRRQSLPRHIGPVRPAGGHRRQRVHGLEALATRAGVEVFGAAAAAARARSLMA